MIGLDTNVLVRYLTLDDADQARKATKLIESGADAGETFYLTSIVMCELVWVLEEAYGYARSEVQAALEAILRVAQFRFDNKDQLWQSLNDYRRGKGDFSDYLIARLAAAVGCEVTATFDRSLQDSRLVRLL